MYHDSGDLQSGEDQFDREIAIADLNLPEVGPWVLGRSALRNGLYMGSKCALHAAGCIGSMLDVSALTVVL